MTKYSQILEEELITEATKSTNGKSFLKYCLDNRGSYNLTVKNWVSEVKDIEIANDTKTRQAIRDNIAIFTIEITKNYPINTKDSGKVIQIDKSDKKYHLLDFFLHETEDFQKICMAIKNSGARNELDFNDNKNTIDLNGKNIPLPENHIKIFYVNKPKNMDQQRRPFQLITGDSSEQSTQQNLIEWFMEMLFGENYEETAEKIRKCYKIETKLDLAQEKEEVKEQLSRLGTNDLQSIKSRCDNTEYITSQKPFEIEFIKDHKNTTLNDNYEKSLRDLLESNEDIKQQEQKKLEECKIDVSFEEDLEGNANVRMVVCVKKGDKIISFFNFDASSCADGFKIYNANFINNNVFNVNKKQDMETEFKTILDNTHGNPEAMCNELAKKDLTFVWKNVEDNEDNKEVYCFGKTDIEAKIKEQANIFTTLKNHETELLDMDKLNEKNISTRNNELQTVIETMGNNNNELLTQLNKNFEDYEKALNGTFKQATTSFKLELTRALKHYGLKDTAELGEITQKAFFTSSIKSQQNALKVTKAGQYKLNTNNELELIESAPSPQVNGGWFNALYRGASQLIGYN